LEKIFQKGDPLKKESDMYSYICVLQFLFLFRPSIITASQENHRGFSYFRGERDSSYHVGGGQGSLIRGGYMTQRNPRTKIRSKNIDIPTVLVKDGTSSPSLSPMLSPMPSPIDSPIDSPINSPIDSQIDSPIDSLTMSPTLSPVISVIEDPSMSPMLPVLLSSSPSPPLQLSISPTSIEEVVSTIVSRLSMENFKHTIQQLSLIGDRIQGTEIYNEGEAWVVEKLRGEYNYTVEFHTYEQNQPYQNWLSWTKNHLRGPRRNLYVTKVGTVRPDQMYIVSAHLDGRGGGGGANDDASGCALILEMARVFASIKTVTTVRFIFWNSEEIGMIGSKYYVQDRKPLQGIEDPSGVYPEPIWLGMIQHDQILYDHGPIEYHGIQSPSADADIEYEQGTVYQDQSVLLANALLNGNIKYAQRYPAEVSDEMYGTDSVRFADHCPSVSIRENQRKNEMNMGWAPNWHQPTDTWDTYTELDYEFGFDIVRMTAGTVAELAGATL